ncbi:MAG: DUF4920 domain-containing protein [Bacteroidia bacterium]|jgi:hypothetical protein|nr:DUF4920 domain-containing protein [Bacteroidia bacterium]
MRNYLFAAIACMAIACSQPAKQDGNQTNDSLNVSATGDSLAYFGEVITEDSAVTFEEMKTLMGNKDSLLVKVTAPVEAVCQKKGCWMELKGSDGNMRVTFKDYGFFVPKDASGKTAVVYGMAKVEVTSVADLKEYAKDDGKSKDEIAAISEPKKELVFEASGVILK